MKTHFLEDSLLASAFFKLLSIHVFRAPFLTESIISRFLSRLSTNFLCIFRKTLLHDISLTKSVMAFMFVKTLWSFPILIVIIICCCEVLKTVSWREEKAFLQKASSVDFLLEVLRVGIVFSTMERLFPASKVIIFLENCKMN